MKVESLKKLHSTVSAHAAISDMGCALAGMDDSFEFLLAYSTALHIVYNMSMDEAKDFLEDAIDYFQVGEVGDSET